jgi:hypothetical protein
MCLYQDDYDDYVYLGEGTRMARKVHRCGECGRTIEAGETYWYQTGVMDGQASTAKMCRHCDAVIELGVRLTGCPRFWFYGSVLDLDPEIGFVGNILEDEGHDLGEAERALMLSAHAASQRGWRDEQGGLLPLPGAVPA